MRPACSSVSSLEKARTHAHGAWKANMWRAEGVSRLAAKGASTHLASEEWLGQTRGRSFSLSRIWTREQRCLWKVRHLSLDQMKHQSHLRGLPYMECFVHLNVTVVCLPCSVIYLQATSWNSFIGVFFFFFSLLQVKFLPSLKSSRVLALLLEKMLYSSVSSLWPAWMLFGGRTERRSRKA